MSAKSSSSIQKTDRRLKQIARIATKAAYDRTLAAGHSVLIAQNGEIRRITPDGRSLLVKKIDPNVAVRKGTVIKIK